MLIRLEITITLFLCVKNIMKKLWSSLCWSVWEVLGNWRDKVLCHQGCASKTTRNAGSASVGMF